jgi:hypothetical protein
MIKPAIDRPPGSIKITGIAFTVHQGRTAPPTSRAHRQPRNQRKEQILAILATQPDHHWHARELSQLLNVPDPHSFTVQMSQWARQGILRRTGRGIYALPLTPAKNP